SFGNFNDARQPESLILAADGNFYGTGRGGTLVVGGQGIFDGRSSTISLFQIPPAAFKMSPAGDVTVLFSSFDGYPTSLIQGSDGDFYGTLIYGSARGAVFRMAANGHPVTLHTFNGDDGSNPTGALVQGSDGN